LPIVLRALHLVRAVALIGGPTYLMVFHGGDLSRPLVAFFAVALLDGVRHLYALLTGRDPLVTVLSRLPRTK